MSQHRHYRVVRFAALVILLLVVAGIRWRVVRNQRSRTGEPTKAEILEAERRLIALEDSRKQIDQTTWATERLAELFGRKIEDLWDNLNHSTTPLQTLATFELSRVILPKFSAPEDLPHGLKRLSTSDSLPLTPALSQGERGNIIQPTVLDGGSWRGFLSDKIADNWQLGQLEFRHIEFDPEKDQQGAKSTFYFYAGLSNSQQNARAVIEGNLKIQWMPGSQPSIASVDASGLTVLKRTGTPPFYEAVVQEFTPPNRSYFIDPLLVYDLDGDGQSEIILASANIVLRRKSWDRFEASPFCKDLPWSTFTAVIADFDGDGNPDLLCATFDGLLLFPGSNSGTFDQPSRLVWKAPSRLRYGQVLTCGDIDRDGHLDVFLGQYKVPYQLGQMPTPFDNANDGNPSYLLKNDGHGNFTDVTIQNGMGEARRRRVYTASFADLNGDGYLDLMMVSDFAGANVYLNNGKGFFKSAAPTFLPNARGFGMAHVITDFNSDGLLDFLMIGMNSPTASRLVHSGKTPAGNGQFLNRIAEVTYGNRAYIGTVENSFRPASFASTLAHTGWSWGAAAPDIDNDGFPDLYIANGHESGNSVKDYEPEFWLHDILVGTASEDPVKDAYFRKKREIIRDLGGSYGGHERNRLFMNLGGKDFLELGWLWGVSMPQDCRNVVADDLDGDGKMDLLVTTFEQGPPLRQVLHIFRNQSTDSGNWIGVRFRENAGRPSPIGSQITLQAGDRTMTRVIVTGDSYRSQHPLTAHFGLGAITNVDSIEIRWPDGKTSSIKHPQMNQYQSVVD